MTGIVQLCNKQFMLNSSEINVKWSTIEWIWHKHNICRYDSSDIYTCLEMMIFQIFCTSFYRILEKTIQNLTNSIISRIKVSWSTCSIFSCIKSSLQIFSAEILYAYFEYLESTFQIHAGNINVYHQLFSHA